MMLTLPSGSLGTQGMISRLVRTAGRWEARQSNKGHWNGGKKAGAQSRASYLGRGAGGKPSRTSTQPPMRAGQSMRLPWTYFQAGAVAQQPKKAAVKCKLRPVPRCWAPGFPIKATTIAGAAAAAEPLPGAGCATSASLAPTALRTGAGKGHRPAPSSPKHSTPGQMAAVIAPPWCIPWDGHA